MPTYTFKDIDTDERSTEVLTVSQCDELLEANPRLRVVITPKGFVAGNGGKPDGVFRDMLKEMKRAHPGSTINTF